MPKRAAASTLAILAFSLGSACRAQEPAQAPMDMSAMDSTDQHATQAAHEAMSGSMAADPHLTLTPTRPGTGADTARAAALVLEMRRALERYGDVRSAEADGFRRFLPGVKQPVYHYTSWRSALAAQFRFDAVRPTSLLYKEGPRGTLVLVGGEHGGGRVLGGFDRQLLRAPLVSMFAGQRLRGLAAKEGAEDLQAVTRLIESGAVTPVIDRTYALADAPDAIRYLAEGHAAGKVVVRV